MTDKELAQELLASLGGEKNVGSVVACMTRLRVDVADTALVDTARIKACEGVWGLVEGETMQIVLGPGTVEKVLREFQGLLDKARAGSRPSSASARGLAGARRVLKKVASVFVTLLPGIIAAGLINGICNVINVASGNAFADAWWYQTIRSVGWALFAYLPILVGYNSAAAFGGSPVLGGIAGMMCVSNSSMPLLALQGTSASAIILPFTGAQYNPAAGNIVVAFLAGAFFAFLERLVRKRMPCVIDTFVSPLLVLLAGVFALIVAIQPVGAALTNVLQVGLTFVYEELGVVGGFILSASFLPLVSVGLHQALTPIHSLLNDPSGPTAGVNYLLPVLMMAGAGQVGAGLALMLKSKNERVKKVILKSLPIGALGVAEPLMYAVVLPLGKPFVTACLGAGFGGALAALFQLGAISMGVSGLLGLLIVVPGQQLLYLLCYAVALAASFILTYLFGVDDSRINDFYSE